MEPALCPWGFPGKNTRVGCHFLLQGIFPTQGSNPCLLHYRWVLYRGAPREAPGCHTDGKCTVTAAQGIRTAAALVCALRPPQKTALRGSGPWIRGRPPAPGQAFPVATTSPLFISRLHFLSTNTAEQRKALSTRNNAMNQLRQTH